MAKVMGTSDIVDRWYASDDSVPSSPPTSEDEERLRLHPGSMRPEIAANEYRHKERYAIAHAARSLFREAVHLSQLEKGD